MEPYIKGRKTLKNPSIRASVQPSSLKARETRNLIRGNRNGRVRRDNEVKERLGNNSPRVRAPNAVGCVSLKELKSLISPHFFTTFHLKTPKGVFLLGWPRRNVAASFSIIPHRQQFVKTFFCIFLRTRFSRKALHHAKVLKRFTMLK